MENQEVSLMSSKQLAVVISGVIIMIFLFGFLCGYPLSTVLVASIIASLFCIFCWYFWYEELGIDFGNYVQMIGGENMGNQENITIEKVEGSQNQYIVKDEASGNEAPQTVVIVESKKKVKGRVIGFFAMAVTVAYAIFLFSYFNGLSTETLSDAISSAIAKKTVEPHLYLSLAGAALSLFGFFAKNKTCMLIASIAMLCAGLVFTMYLQMIILPAVLLFIAFLRMNKTK